MCWRLAAFISGTAILSSVSCLKSESARPALVHSGTTTRPEAEVAAEFDKTLGFYVRTEPVHIKMAAGSWRLEASECSDCPALNRASRYEDVALDVLLTELKAHPRILSRFIKVLAQSCSIRPNPVLLGTRRADIDFQTGDSRIEIYGLILGDQPADIDPKSGLFREFCGDVCYCDEHAESAAYNARTREWLARQGLSADARERKARYEKSLSFQMQRPNLSWTTLDLKNAVASEQQANLGALSVRYVLEEHPKDNYKCLSIHTAEGQKRNTVLCWEYKKATQARIAFWEGVGVLVLESSPSGEFTFVDPPTGRRLWTFSREKPATSRSSP